jgi:hypothetical protein
MDGNVRRIRIQRKVRMPRDRTPVLPLDPRDPDIERAKRLERSHLGAHV